MDTTRIIAAIALGVVAVVIAVAVFSPGRSTPDVAASPTGDTSVAPTSTVPETTSTTVELPRLRAAPALEDLDGWLQTDIARFDDLRGSVVILQFWTYSCRNCKATIPYLQDIYAEHKSAGLEIVGVHAPEFEFEKDPAGILEAAADLGVTWPIALDTNKRNFHSWQEGNTAYWPRTYVIDRDGQIRFDHIGEGAYEELEQTVEALLGTS